LFNETTSIPATNRLNVFDINANYLYFFDGQNLEARTKTTGVLLQSTVVSATYTGGVGYQNEGIAADVCDIVHVGGQGQVYRYSFDGTNFNALPSDFVPGNVYDIALDQTHQLMYVVGNGFLNSISAPITCPPPGMTATPSSSGCGGAGKASVSVSGGNAPFTYSWSNGVTAVTTSASDTITAPSGNYTVTISDGSCSNVQVTTAAVTVGTSGGPAINSMTPANPPCFGQSGSATVAASGGTGALTYNWSSGISASSTHDSGLTAGTYTVTITDASGCVNTSSVKIVAPTVLSANASQSKPATCGNADGAASSTPTGGTGAYTWSWAGIAGNTSSVAGLTAGTYTVTVSDANGCTASGSATIQNSNGPTLTLLAADSICPGAGNGQVSISATGGTGPFTYSWSNGASGITSSAGFLDSNLGLGTYSLTVSDAGGCTATASAGIFQFKTPAITAGPDTSINLGQQVRIHVTGGPGYLWTPSSTLTNPNTLNPLADPTSTTTYTVLVTDANKCQQEDSVTITVLVPLNCDTLSIFVPTAFSPNGDGKNDILYVKGVQTCLSQLLFQVYDRWGEKVFETTNLTQGWDGSFHGKRMDSAVFVFYLNASLSTGQKITRKGNITLLK